MPQVVRSQVILNDDAATNMQIMNTWHCVTVGATTSLAAAEDFHQALQAFYATVDIQLSTELNGSTPLVRHFDLSDPKPRQPILEEPMPALACGTGSTAREIACCLSYKGTYLSGVSPKRKRGRIYIGPLASNCIASTGLLSPSLQSSIQSAADTLLTTSSGSSTFRWVIYSPTSDPTGEGNDAGCWDAVTSGWVDNNPDVQRRRSVIGGSREVFS